MCFDLSLVHAEDPCALPTRGFARAFVTTIILNLYTSEDPLNGINVNNTHNDLANFPGCLACFSFQLNIANRICLEISLAENRNLDVLRHLELVPSIIIVGKYLKCFNPSPLTIFLRNFTTNVRCYETFYGEGNVTF